VALGLLAPGSLLFDSGNFGAGCSILRTPEQTFSFGAGMKAKNVPEKPSYFLVWQSSTSRARFWQVSLRVQRKRLKSQRPAQSPASAGSADKKRPVIKAKLRPDRNNAEVRREVKEYTTESYFI